MEIGMKVQPKITEILKKFLVIFKKKSILYMLRFRLWTIKNIFSGWYYTTVTLYSQIVSLVEAFLYISGCSLIGMY